ncbi:MAG: YkgJ family cysteine cluster protein [Fluviicola sp.]|jgi:Fe-S-cluster containining protein
MDLEQHIKHALAEKETYIKWVKKAKKMNSRSLDNDFHSMHTAVFQKIDCLSCANCCKTTSPIFRDVDVRRLAKRLRLSESKFIDTYLKMDEEGDYVLKQSPCAFLGDDNYCSVYEDRPLACREYPHTDRKNMYQILDLTRKNMEVCPAVSLIMQQLAQK